MGLDNKMHVIICDHNTCIRLIKFIQGDVISSEHTIKEYVHKVPRQKLKKQSKSMYIMHIDRIFKPIGTT